MERRYLANYNVNSCESKSFDVVIIGAGIAGLYTALMLSKNLRVAVLSKRMYMIVIHTWLKEELQQVYKTMTDSFM
ncbi:FAD-dependent oxidoreductase [Clostridium ljungdahlii]|uniref:FAD-dependent oxidoreductase n=1 Tax=Clostridium ljungdahlii TaxID=1538 RepID=UPI00386ED1C6